MFSFLIPLVLFLKYMGKFNLHSEYSPAGDQPQAIKQINSNFAAWKNRLTLLGATGTGKTFTMANIIQKQQKPTLIISHNKTLAAQLATEFKHFFPNNAVHYFVSYFDYYQPESYLPEQGLYIEKEATINQEIEMYRLATMASLLSRKDVIVVASVSALYGLGQKRFFEENCLQLEIGQHYDFKELKSQLLHMQYKPVQSKIEQGMFDFRWDTLELFSSTERNVFRLHFNEEKLELIEIKETISYKHIKNTEKITLWPATQFLQDMDDVELILKQMQAEMEERVKYFTQKKMFVEAERIKKRVSYDIRMIKETGFTNGIENYSPYFDKRLPGEPPNTLFDYFPDDFLMIFDESHMTIPQLQAMPKADKSRKINLIDHGFRLPSAIDHRPINFQELEVVLWWKDAENFQWDWAWTTAEIAQEARTANQRNILAHKQKKHAKTLFASATPANYELQLSQYVIEQIIRPTGLLDPITYVYPKSGDYNAVDKSIEALLQKKPHLKHYFQQYHHDEKDFKDLFGGK